MSVGLQNKNHQNTPAREKPNRLKSLGLTSETLETLLLVVSVAGTLSLLGLALWFCRYGLEFTDEGLYFVQISNPFIYSSPIPPSQFGFIYHPLYELLGGNIAALRQASILITYILAWVLTHLFLSTTIAEQLNRSARGSEKFRLKYFILSAGFAATSLSSIIIQGQWLATPSYNTLAFQALLIAATGMLLADKKPLPKTLLGWTIIGIGGWLAFMAKPTTAAALGIVVILYLLAAKKFNFFLVLVSIVVALGLLTASAFAIDGTISGFISRHQTGYDLSVLNSPGYSFFLTLAKLAAFPFHSARSMVLYAIAAAIMIAAFYSQKTLLKSIAYSALATPYLIIAFRMTHAGSFGGDKIQFLLNSVFMFFLMLGIPFAIACTACTNRCKGLFLLSRGQWGIALCFFIFPIIYSFGCSGDYWYRGCSAGFFWTLSALLVLVIISGADFRRILPFSLSTVVVIAAVLLNGLVSPKRQPFKLWQNNYSIKIGGAKLMLASSYGQYIEKAIISAQNAGFKEGTPVIDLTGLSPGLLYAIRAINIGQAWTMGGLPGSDRVAIEYLKKVSPEQIAASWVLMEPTGPHPVSSQVLSCFGADIDRDYEAVASWSTPKDDYFGPRIQKLLRPARPFSNIREKR